VYESLLVGVGELFLGTADDEHLTIQFDRFVR
jgi:hypothetical protein